MARTRSRRGRGASRRAGSPAPTPDILTAGRFLLRPQVLGTVLVVLAAASLPYLLPLAGVLDEARDGLVRALGLHVFTLVVAAAAFGALLALRRTWWLGRHRRHALGISAVMLFGAGLLGHWFPATQVGTVDLGARSAGGDLGRALVSGGPVSLAWALLPAVAFVALWPRTALDLLRSAAPAARTGLREVSRALAAGVGLAWRAAAATARAPFRRRRTAPAFPADGLRPGGEWEARELAAPEKIPPDLAADEAGGVPLAGNGAAPPEVEDAAGPDRRDGGVPEKPAAQIPMDMEIPAAEWRHSSDGWQLPPVSLLAKGDGPQSAALDNKRRAALIEETLASFGVDARVTQINEGPAVTQFGIEPGWDVRTRTVIERDAAGHPVLDGDGRQRSKEIEVSRTRIRVNRITTLQNDLALALAAPALRIEAPVPGKPMVGIEVPNTSFSAVTLRSVLESAAFRRGVQRWALPIALGAGVSGEAVVADLAKMPHLLIAGATGSGKSVCLNALITCLLMHHSPEQLRLVLIDPKRVELTAFAKVPHLAFSEIIVDMDRVVGTLQAVTNEMESRYRQFARTGVRDIASYNEKVEGRKMPAWVVIIDELADLMLAGPYQVEHQIVRLAQLARATGIHLVIATQRPSVDVVTGLIKANFPTRIAFAVASQVDSRTVLDGAGAEKLLGRGDMLYMATDAQKPKRLQGVFVSDAETEAVVNFWTHDRFGDLSPEKHDDLLRDAEHQVERMETAPAEDADPMLERALQLARDQQRISTSMLQRRLRFGYPRAARIMDEFEQRGIVGPPEPGGSSREVLMMPEATPALAAGDAAPGPPAGDGDTPPDMDLA